jgi:hypothetical protein
LVLTTTDAVIIVTVAPELATPFMVAVMLGVAAEAPAVKTPFDAMLHPAQVPVKDHTAS